MSLHNFLYNRVKQGEAILLFLCLFQLVPGETALAFYTATNPTDQAITGISTYNVIPFDAGQYFNKIQVTSHQVSYLKWGSDCSVQTLDVLFYCSIFLLFFPDLNTCCGYICFVIQVLRLILGFFEYDLRSLNPVPHSRQQNL